MAQGERPKDHPLRTQPSAAEGPVNLSPARDAADADACQTSNWNRAATVADADANPEDRPRFASSPCYACDLDETDD
jgi:hypothetical protein